MRHSSCLFPTREIVRGFVWLFLASEMNVVRIARVIRVVVCMYTDGVGRTLPRTLIGQRMQDCKPFRA